MNHSTGTQHNNIVVVSQETGEPLLIALPPTCSIVLFDQLPVDGGRHLTVWEIVPNKQRDGSLRDPSLSTNAVIVKVA